MLQLDDVMGPLLGRLAEAIGPEAADAKALTVPLLAATTEESLRQRGRSNIHSALRWLDRRSMLSSCCGCAESLQQNCSRSKWYQKCYQGHTV